MIRITAVYPNGADSHFDADYYGGRHLALAERLLRPHGLTGVEVSLGVSALDGTPPPYWAIGTMLFASVQAFTAAMEACGEELMADGANYTNVTPVLQVSRAIGSLESGD